MIRFVGQEALEHQMVVATETGYRLQSSHCASCDSNFFPPRELCPHDLSVLSQVDVSPTGRLYEIVRVDTAPRGFQTPYWLCYVDFPEGIRIFGQLERGQDVVPQAGDIVAQGVGVVREDPDPTLGPVFFHPSPTQGAQP